MPWSAWITHAFFWLTGARAENGTAYGLLSGVGGAIPDVMLPLGAVAWWWRGTCHHSWRCLRWGKYPAANGTFRLCHVHHPDLLGQKPHRDLIARLHEEHKARR